MNRVCGGGPRASDLPLIVRLMSLFPFFSGSLSLSFPLSQHGYSLPLLRRLRIGDFEFDKAGASSSVLPFSRLVSTFAGDIFQFEILHAFYAYLGKTVLNKVTRPLSTK